jgi:F-type H+-transporting ATPase subunit b
LNLKINKFILAEIILLLGVCWFFAPDTEVFAADELSSGRRLWDNILLFINFGILVFFFIKYARKPLMDFLRGARTDVESGLNKVEAQLNHATSLRDAELDKLKNIQAQIDKIRANILELGRHEKEKHIEEGKIAAENMIEHAKKYAQRRIQETKKVLADEMIDRAFSTVEKVFAKEFSPKDNDNVVNQFLNDLKTTKQHLS